MKPKERISFEVPAETYRVLRELMLELDLKTVADVVRHLMKESPSIVNRGKDLDFGERQWGGKRTPKD